MRAGAVAVGSVIFVAALVAFACSSTSTSSTKTEPCSPAEAVPCIAASGCDGLKVCRADGRGFSECSCADGGSGGAGGGSDGASGSGGAGGARSCAALAATCGPNADEDCCTSPVVAGGTYDRSNDPAFPATISDFRLDRFEVTVGRFRKFVAAYPGSKPAADAGAHPRILGSSWDSTWDGELPTDAAALVAAIRCSTEFSTWTEAPAANETLPINCLNWYVAFAFCAWDGARLPTEAEWNYAAAGGNEQRVYPWGATAPDPTYAVYDCTGDGAAACDATDFLRVGARSPKGDGKSWAGGAQADLAGSVAEWTLDYADFTTCCNAPYSNSTCSNCANLSPPAGRVVRGGAFNDAVSTLPTTVRTSDAPGDTDSNRGLRCARNP
jgi:formylglycine-generating enzyme